MAGITLRPSDSVEDDDPLPAQGDPPGLGGRLVPAAAIAVMVALAAVLVWRVGALDEENGRVPAVEMVVPIPAP